MSIFKKTKPKPIIMNDKIGTFVLEDPKKSKMYEGTINWRGEQGTAFLRKDSSNETTAESALKYLRELLANNEEWDKRIKEFATDDFSDENDLVEIWGDSNDDDIPPPITREEFISRISFNFVDISPDGDLFFDYDLDNMFTDHSLGISANISGTISETKLWG